MPRFARINPLGCLLAALALFTLAFALSASHADAKSKKKPPSVRAKVAKKTLTVTGSRKADVIVLRVKKRAAKTLEIDIGGNGKADFRFARSRFTKIVVRGTGGNDTLRIDERNGVFTKSEKTTLKGDAGNDQIAGGAGAESISGGTGNDAVDTGAGKDRASLGAGDDVLRTDPADGADRTQGDAGNDRLAVIGAAGSDNLAASANGPRLNVTRGGAAAVDADDFESLELSALGGADSIDVGDLNGTDVKQATTDLAAALGGASGDGAPDNVAISGSGAGDDIGVGGSDGSFQVSGLSYAIAGTHAEPGADRLTVSAGGGNDAISASGLATAALPLTADGGAGADSLSGSGAANVLIGGDDDDTFRSDPGDGSDRIEGQGGNDRILVGGSDADNRIELAADAGRLRITRDDETADADDVESVDANGRGGTDAIAVHDLAGSDVRHARIELGDGNAEEITVEGSAGDEKIDVSGSESTVNVSGTPAAVDIHADAGADRLTVDGKAGKDALDAANLPAGVVALTLSGGDDSDLIGASNAADVVIGGKGDDVASLRGGDDTFRWDPGDGSDTVDGQDGANDRLDFNGSDGQDKIRLSAAGGRLRVAHEGDGATLDGDEIEDIDVDARGGGDDVGSANLAGTDVTKANLDLGDDDAGDSATAVGTNGPDTLGATGGPGVLDPTGLGKPVHFTNVKKGDDKLVIDSLGGADTVDTSAVPAATADVVADLGDGGDQFTGGDSSDRILGGAGNDVATPARGDDVALLGGDEDTFVWNPGHGSDTIEGQDGADTMVFNGANISEQIGVSANGGRVRFTRNVANVVMDLNDVESIDFEALGGADNITVGDLNGTDLTALNADLGSGAGTGDGSADTITVDGTGGDDVILAAGDASGTTVIGLSALVNITRAEVANDRLRINALAGDDIIEASGLAVTAIALTEDGGNDDDVLIGGSGGDVLLGGSGDDVLIGGPGQDVLDAGTGANVVIQD